MNGSSRQQVTIIGSRRCNQTRMSATIANQVGESAFIPRLLAHTFVAKIISAFQLGTQVVIEFRPNLEHQSRHHAQPPSQAAGVCYAFSAPELLELTPFERDGLGARSLCSVMWPLLAPFASPLLAIVEYFWGMGCAGFRCCKKKKRG